MTKKFILSQEDGTVAGGNKRGDGAVDLQTSRAINSQVASGAASVIVGGAQNSNSSIGGFIGGGVLNSIGGADNYQAIVGGQQNTIGSSGHSFIGAGLFNTIQNASSIGASAILGGQSNSITAGARYSSIGGGQSNTASTGTHATVVGGQSNVSSGNHSISGGRSNTASGVNAVAFGRSNAVSGASSVTLGTEYSSATGYCSAVIGAYNSGTFSSNSAVIGGDYGSTYMLGQVSTGVRMSGSSGYDQSSYIQAYREVQLSSGGTASLSLDGTGTTNLIFVNVTKTWNVRVTWVAKCKNSGIGTTISQESSIGTDVFMFRYDSGTVTSYISPITSLQSYAETSMVGANLTYSVVGTQQLGITFNAPSTANATTFKVLAKIELVELN